LNTRLTLQTLRSSYSSVQSSAADVVNDGRHPGLQFSLYSNDRDGSTLQRVPYFDILSAAPLINESHPRVVTVSRDFSSVSLNLSVGLSSFAEVDILKSQKLGFAPNWVDATSFMNTKSVSSDSVSVSAASGLLSLDIIPGRTWLVTLPVSVKVSLNDGLFGVGSPVVAAVDLFALQPIVTFQDLPDALHNARDHCHVRVSVSFEFDSIQLIRSNFQIIFLFIDLGAIGAVVIAAVLILAFVSAVFRRFSSEYAALHPKSATSARLRTDIEFVRSEAEKNLGK